MVLAVGILETPEAALASGRCGTRVHPVRNGGDRFAAFKVRRTRAGVLNYHGHRRRFVKVQLNYAARRAFRANASFTSIFAIYTSARTHKMAFGENDTSMKFGRPNFKRYYAHTTVTVAPGSEILFSGHIKFTPPYEIAPNTFLHGDKYEGDCIAR